MTIAHAEDHAAARAELAPVLHRMLEELFRRPKR